MLFKSAAAVKKDTQTLKECPKEIGISVTLYVPTSSSNSARLPNLPNMPGKVSEKLSLKGRIE